MWYRVLTGILKPGELTKVYSIDLGNVAYLIPTNMKKLPLELNFHPAHVYQCMLGKIIFHNISSTNVLS